MQLLNICTRKPKDRAFPTVLYKSNYSMDIIHESHIEDGILAGIKHRAATDIPLQSCFQGQQLTGNTWVTHAWTVQDL